MQLAVFVLSKTELLDDFLIALAANGIRGATVLDSKGMAHALPKENSFAASLRLILTPGHEEGKTIFAVVPDEKVSVISQVANRVCGSLNGPESGILFALPVSYTEGIKF